MTWVLTCVCAGCTGQGARPCPARGQRREAGSEQPDLGGLTMARVEVRAGWTVPACQFASDVTLAEQQAMCSHAGAKNFAYKYGSTVVKADRWHPSSTTCSRRGAVKTRLALGPTQTRQPPPLMGAQIPKERQPNGKASTQVCSSEATLVGL
jgi:hypothetical protein